MAGSSVDVSKIFPDPKKVVFVYDNERRNVEIIRLMAKAAKSGYGVCVWPEKNIYKDINEMIMAGRNQDRILKEIKEHTYFDLEAILEITKWKKCDV
jgi:hypothetical protein